MKIIDPGHIYELFELDNLIIKSPQKLTFVKRQGNKYPGNYNHFPGTNLQDVYRACIDRHIYLDNQDEHPCNARSIERLRQNIMDLEIRAAEKHNRIPIINDIIETEPFCSKCGHVGCNEK